jgi:Methyltransferase FkbM domain
MSSVNGLGKMIVPNGNNYRARLADAGQRVRLVNMDELFAGDVAFIKCDVEGHEIEIIESATNLIERGHPVWLIEVSGDRTIELMRERGYRAIHLLHDWVFVAETVAGRTVS